MNDKLKTCPFCGGKAEMGTEYNDPFECGAIYCVDCGAKIEFGCGGELRQKGIAAWNRRAMGQLEARNLESFLKIFQEVKNTFCSCRDCGHFSCTACINGCYGEECAFDAVEDAIYEMKEMEVK